MNYAEHKSLTALVAVSEIKPILIFYMIQGTVLCHLVLIEMRPEAS